MTVQDLINELENQNGDSEVVVFSVVVRDSLSNELISITPDGYNGFYYKNLD